jgi:hypothetical protein
MPSFAERIKARKFTSASSTALDVGVNGESDARLAVDAGGKLIFGSGSAAGDTTLYRSAADTLKTDDVFQAAAGVVTLTTAGAPSSSIANGALAVDTTNDALYFRSNSTWNPVTTIPTSLDGGSATAIYDGVDDVLDGGTA